MRAKKCALKDRKCRRAKKCYRARRIFRIRHFVKRCKREDIFKRPIVHYHLHKKNTDLLNILIEKLENGSFQKENIFINIEKLLVQKLKQN